MGRRRPRPADYGVSYEWYRARVFVSNGAQFPVNAIDVNKVLRCQVVRRGLTDVHQPESTAPAPLNLDRRRRSPATPGSAAPSAATAARGTTTASTRTPSPTSGCAPASPIDGATGADLHDHGRRRQPRHLLPRHRRRLHHRDLRRRLDPAAARTPCSPRIEGDPRVDSDAHLHARRLGRPRRRPYAVTYQWYRGAARRSPDATSATYKSGGGRRRALHCRVARREPHDRQLAARSPSPRRRPAASRCNLITPAISGDRRLRQHADLQPRQLERHRRRPLPRHLPLAPQQRRDRRRHRAQYTITAADIGQSLNCEVTADTAAGRPAHAPRRRSPPPRAPIVAPAHQRRPAPAPDAELLARRLVRRRRPTATRSPTAGCATATAITGATDATYTLTPADIGTSLELRGPRRGPDRGAARRRSAARAPRIAARPGPDRPTRACARRSAARAARGTTSPPTATRSRYTWQRDSVAITGQTDPTYTVTAADTGHSISCTARAENLTNATPVQRRRDRPRARSTACCRASPATRACARRCRCTRGDWDDDAADRYAVTYRWLRDGIAIPDATSATYSPPRADVRHEHRAAACAPRTRPTRLSAALAIRRPDNILAPGDLRRAAPVPHARPAPAATGTTSPPTATR